MLRDLKMCLILYVYYLQGFFSADITEVQSGY